MDGRFLFKSAVFHIVNRHSYESCQAWAAEAKALTLSRGTPWEDDACILQLAFKGIEPGYDALTRSCVVT